MEHPESLLRSSSPSSLYCSSSLFFPLRRGFSDSRPSRFRNPSPSLLLSASPLGSFESPSPTPSPRLSPPERCSPPLRRLERPFPPPPPPLLPLPPSPFPSPPAASFGPSSSPLLRARPRRPPAPEPRRFPPFLSARSPPPPAPSSPPPVFPSGDLFGDFAVELSLEPLSEDSESGVTSVQSVDASGSNAESKSPT